MCSPSLKNIKVGTPLILYLLITSLFSSTFIFFICNLSLYCTAILSSMDNVCIQGLHHGAQKSTNIKPCASSTCCLKFLSFILRIISLILITLGVALIVVFAVIRPTFRNLTDAGAQAKEAVLGNDGDGTSGMDGFSLDGVDAGVSITGGGGEFLLPGASEGYDKQVNALKGLVAEDPARVAQVVRTWVNADG